MTNKENYPDKDITEKIIGAAMKVHSFLGCGFQEIIYQRALGLEMEMIGLEFQREVEQNIFYRDHEKSIGTRRVDFLVGGRILVELKAISSWKKFIKLKLLIT